MTNGLACGSHTLAPLHVLASIGSAYVYRYMNLKGQAASLPLQRERCLINGTDELHRQSGSSSRSPKYSKSALRKLVS